MKQNIHFCWFGPNSLSSLNIACQASWGKYAPNAKIYKWDESNSPVDNPVVKAALKDKKWAFASDYVRLWAVYNYGGIYFDTDMELIKNIDELFHLDCFLGYQDDELINNGAFGAQKGSPFVKACLDRMERNYKLGQFEISPVITTRTLESQDFDENIVIYPCQTFYPYKPNRDEVGQLMFKDIVPETIAIHHWEHSWKLTIFDRVKMISRKYLKKFTRKILGR
ncbi:hypothetical protein L4D00_03420 [Photobacterium swingsii]|uniref:glycosyltransferase family 32 protein n=1 Tax=Photobacterium swingsii TaxID=680026 RepID=UPI003D0DB979